MLRHKFFFFSIQGALLWTTAVCGTIWPILWGSMVHVCAEMGLASCRAISTNRVVTDKYFDPLEEVLESNNLTKKPHLIFNVDETSMPLHHRPGKSVAVRGQKHVHAAKVKKTKQVAVLACASASGCILPPMIMYKRKKLNLAT